MAGGLGPAGAKATVKAEGKPQRWVWQRRARRQPPPQSIPGVRRRDLRGVPRLGSVVRQWAPPWGWKATREAGENPLMSEKGASAVFHVPPRPG